MKDVLVVDDTKNIRILLKKCLELEGYNVITASDGHQALELFKSRKFDLAFLDVKMTQLSGTEVLKQIREIGIKTPVIIITAYATIKNAVECTQMGAVAYLQKPFTAEKVRTVLNELIGINSIRIDISSMEAQISHIKDAINNRSFNIALETLKKVISEEPTNPDVYLLFSKVYNEMGENKLANEFKSVYDTLKLKNNL